MSLNSFLSPRYFGQSPDQKSYELAVEPDPEDVDSMVEGEIGLVRYRFVEGFCRGQVAYLGTYEKPHPDPDLEVLDGGEVDQDEGSHGIVEEVVDVVSEEADQDDGVDEGAERASLAVVDTPAEVEEGLPPAVEPFQIEAIDVTRLQRFGIQDVDVEMPGRLRATLERLVEEEAQLLKRLEQARSVVHDSRYRGGEGGQLKEIKDRSRAGDHKADYRQWIDTALLHLNVALRVDSSRRFRFNVMRQVGAILLGLEDEAAFKASEFCPQFLKGKEPRDEGKKRRRKRQ